MGKENNIESIAKSYSWDRVETKDSYLKSFVKIVDEAPVRLNVWAAKRTPLFTVGLQFYEKNEQKNKYRYYVRLADLDQIFKEAKL